jgi:hypothetical protein
MRYPLPDVRGSERCGQSRVREQADLFYSIRITMLAELNSRSQLRNPGLMFRIGFQKPLWHAALAKDNTLADEPAPALLDQFGAFTPVLGNLRR